MPTDGQRGGAIGGASGGASAEQGAAVSERDEPEESESETAAATGTHYALPARYGRFPQK